MLQIGPRQERLVDAWASTIGTAASGRNYDFTSPTRTERLCERADRFLDAPSEETFGALWSSEIIRNATYGGPDTVLNNWNRPIEELTAFVRTIRDADAYDPAWERQVPAVVVPALWEIYGRLQPAERPIINSWVRRALPIFGPANPQTHADGVERLAAFREWYEHRVGHVTAQTDHAVPLYDEIEQFLYVAVTLDETALRESLGMAEQAYDTFAGWDAMRARSDRTN
ncbi:MAG: hypothetical protein ABEH78_01170 [Haloferacaceae archaeon]